MAQPKSPSSRRVLALAAPVVAGALLFSACSKKDDTATTSSTTAATASSGGSGSSGTTAKTNDTKSPGTTPGTVKGKTVKVDNTVYYLGFKITLGDGTIDEDAGTFSFVDATIENLGSENASLYGEYNIEAEGTNAYNGGWDKTPEVVAKAKAKDTLTFQIDDKFDPEVSTLVMGPGTEQQVRIALDGSGKVTTLVPVDQAAIAPVTVGNMTFDLSKVVVRYDRIDNHTQVESGNVYVILAGTATNASSEETYYFGNDNFVLNNLDGTKSPADYLEGDGSVAANQKDGKFALVFKVKEPFAGDYTIDVKGPWGASSADETGTIKLSLVAAGKATTTGTTPTGSTPGTTKAG